MDSKTEEVYLSPHKTDPTTLVLQDSIPAPFVLLSNIPTFVSIPEFFCELSAFFPFISGARILLSDMPDSYSALLRTSDVEKGAVAIRQEMNLKPISALAKESLFVSFVHSCACEGDLEGLVGNCAIGGGQLNLGESAAAGAGAPRSPAMMPQRSGSDSQLGGGSFVLHPSASSSPTGSKTARQNNKQHHQHSAPTGGGGPTGNSPTMHPAAYPGPHPTNCTICLDALSDAPQLTIPCGHNFHLECFSNVIDEHCPLCRYCIAEDPVNQAHCSVCNSSNDLWMCLICGSVLCGRQSNSHGVEHYSQTSHTFALQVGGYRVWDYQSDCFVHRLISTLDDSANNAASGSASTGAIDMSSKNAWWFDEDDNDELERAIFASKNEAVASFYSDLLQEQLKQQTEYYSRLIGSVVTSNNQQAIEDDESNGRMRVQQAALNGYRSIMAASRVQALTAGQRLKGECRRLQKDIEEMSVTVESLSEAQHKMSMVMEGAKSKHGAKAGPLQARLGILQGQFEALLEGFQ